MINTNQLYNLNGDGAPDFPAGMPTVDGDPIVESGSNSDGEWTRWADGTQWCGYEDDTVYSTSQAQSSLYRDPDTRVFTFPVAFAVKPKITPSGLYDSGSGLGPFCISLSVTNTQGFIRALSGGVTDVYYVYSATGRWK